MTALEKTFECFTCKQPVKLERKPDNSGWLKTNLDGTPHIDQKKKQQQQQGQKALQSSVSSSKEEHIEPTTTTTTTTTTTRKQLAELKADLQMMIMKVEAIEKEIRA
jgi:hypothetical protein